MKLIQLFEYRETLNEFNVINIEQIDKVTQEYTNKLQNQQAKDWFLKQVKKFLINSQSDVEMANIDPQEVGSEKEWLKKALEKGEKLFQFNLSPQTHQHLDHIVDWLNSEQGQEVAPKLFKVTVPQAIEASNKWTERLNKKIILKKGAVEQGLEDFLDFDDGYSWVLLTNKDCLGREGKLMGHCVGTYDKYASEGTKIYSLRDPENNPHVTVEVTHNKIQQIKGKENNPPTPQYIPYVEAFLKKINLKVDSYDLKRMGMFYSGEKLINIFKIPAGTVIEGDLDISNMLYNYSDNKKEDFSLSNNLTVTGKLTMKKMKLPVLPKGLKVDGLDLEGSTIGNETLPDDLQTQNLNINLTNIKIIPNSLNKFNRLSADQSALEVLPENLQIIEGCALTNCKNLIKLPKIFKVGKGLYLTGSSISEMSENLFVGGILNIDSTHIKRMPKKYVVKGEIKLTPNQFLEEIPNNTSYKNLYIDEKLPNVTTIGNNIKVGALIVTSDKVYKLPENLTASEWIDIKNCPNITEVPVSMKTPSLALVNTGVENLPDGFTTTELILKGNSKMRQLNENITIDHLIVTADDAEFVKWLKKSKFKDMLRIQPKKTII